MVWMAAFHPDGLSLGCGLVGSDGGMVGLTRSSAWTCAWAMERWVPARVIWSSNCSSLPSSTFASSAGTSCASTNATSTRRTSAPWASTRRVLVSTVSSNSGSSTVWTPLTVREAARTTRARSL